MHIDQRHYDKQPTSKGEKIFILVVSAVFIFMMAMEIMSNYEPKKLSALLFAVSWIPLLFIHEFGHAITAKVLGWRVRRIVIGFGKVLFNTHLLGAPMEIRSIPLEGFVQIAPKNLKLARIKHALIYFAGPGIELLIFIIVVFALGGLEQFFIITNDYGRIALQSFAFSALIGAVLNLIPLGIITKDGSAPNDGMGILMCLFSTEMDYELWVRDANKKKK